MLEALLVTIKLPKNKEHNPHAKQEGPCPVSNKLGQTICTDITGEHHTLFFWHESDVAKLKASGVHITRVESVIVPTPTLAGIRG